MVDRTHWRAFGHLPFHACWAVLSLGKPVDSVVKKDDVDIEVPAKHVDKMIATNRQRIPVTGDYPNHEIGSD